MPEPADQAQEEPAAPERLRRSFLRPSRGQAVVAVLLALLAFAAVTQVRIADDDTYANLREPELIQALNGLQAASRRAERDISNLEETRDRLRSTSRRREAAVDEARQRAQTLGILAGTIPASGQGIRVTVSDPSTKLSLNHLLDGIEELRNAGVEAMTINDSVRVVAQTSFEDDPQGIRVDGKLLKPPYVIDAIGSPTTLSKALTFDGGFVDDVELGGGSVDIQQRDRVEVTVTRKPAPPRFAQPVEDQ